MTVLILLLFIISYSRRWKIDSGARIRLVFLYKLTILFYSSWLMYALYGFVYKLIIFVLLVRDGCLYIVYSLYIVYTYFTMSWHI